MDTALSNALRQRDKIRTTIMSLQAELTEIERFLRLYERYSDQPLDLENPQKPSLEAAIIQGRLEIEELPVEKAAEANPRNPGLSKEELKPHIRDVILAAAKPLTRGLLLRALDLRGAKVGGVADRSKNLGTIMWRLKDDFVNIEGFGYWPKDVPYGPARYAPMDTKQEHSGD